MCAGLNYRFYRHNKKSPFLQTIKSSLLGTVFVSIDMLQTGPFADSYFVCVLLNARKHYSVCFIKPQYDPGL